MVFKWQPLDVLKRCLRMAQVFRLTYSYLMTARKYGREFGTDAPHYLEALKIQWARQILGLVRVEAEVIGQPVPKDGCLLVGNHLSYLDIPLIMSEAKTVFVAKKQVSHWPVIGAAAKYVGAVFVDRGSEASRQMAGFQIAEKATKNRKNVVVFPSGTTCMNESKKWRAGAFKIAQQFGVPVQPFRIWYAPLRPTAYIDDDFFPLHLMRLMRWPRIKAYIEFHPPVMIEDPVRDAERWQGWSCDRNFRARFPLYDQPVTGKDSADARLSTPRDLIRT